MEIINNRSVFKIVTLVTKDLDFIEKHACDCYPNAVWIDLGRLAEKEIAEFIQDLDSTAHEMLLNGQVDYIIIEYDI